MSHSIRICTRQGTPQDLETTCLRLKFSYVGMVNDYYEYRKNDVEVLIKLKNDAIKTNEIFITTSWRNKHWKEIYEPASVLFGKFGGTLSGDGIDDGRLPKFDEWVKKMEINECLG